MNEIILYTEFLVKSICQEPDLVKVSCYDGEDGAIMDVIVPEKDMGAVIGKAGKTAASIRTLVLAYAYLHQLGRIKINFDSF